MRRGDFGVEPICRPGVRRHPPTTTARPATARCGRLRMSISWDASARFTRPIARPRAPAEYGRRSSATGDRGRDVHRRADHGRARRRAPAAQQAHGHDRARPGRSAPASSGSTPTSALKHLTGTGSAICSIRAAKKGVAFFALVVGTSRVQRPRRSLRFVARWRS